jgi:nucleotide-binding universal stress UspA family protein
MDIRPDRIRPNLDLGDGCPSILVAVNGRASGWQALEWAVAECAASRSPLRIVHASNDTLLMLDPLGDRALLWLDEAPEHGARVLDEAARRAGLVASDVVISTRLEVGATAASVRRAARKDSLIVVGRGPTNRRGLRSTGWRIARRARGPVIIVELDDERRIGPSAGRVVLGIDDSAGPPAAVVYAFQAASRRGIGLTVIHACPPRTGSRRRNEGGRVLNDLRKLAAIDDALQEYGDAFPDVDVRRRFVAGAAGPALVSESDGAALLVIGARSPSRLNHTRLSPEARTALRWARSPVALIRTPHASSPARVTERSPHRGSDLCTPGTATDA